MAFPHSDLSDDDRHLDVFRSAEKVIQRSEELMKRTEELLRGSRETLKGKPIFPRRGAQSSVTNLVRELVPQTRPL